MLFWHIGASIAFIRYAFRDPAMDLRFLAVGAILSDLFDTPIGALLWGRFGSVRLIGHTMVFAATLLVVVLVATRRGSVRKRWILFPVGVLLHLALDGMWRVPETLWWPFLGAEFARSGFATYGAYVRDLVADPWMWVGEIAGLGYLVVLWVRSGLNGRSVRSAFLRTGVVDAPIGRH